jgi:hypothetical protein
VSCGTVACGSYQLFQDLPFDGFVLVGANRSAGPQEVVDLVPSGQQTQLYRGTYLRRHCIEREGFVRADRDAVATVDTQFFATFNELRTLSFVPDLNYPCRTLVYAEPVLLAFFFINRYETHDLFLSHRLSLRTFGSN